MSKIFITGSADGLGSLSARALIARGHNVTLHARNVQRADDAEKACPGAAGVLVADLSSIEATKSLAKELNDKGPWDAIIHNAGVMRTSSSTKGPEGLPVLFATNTLAPYILTCLVQPPPKRLVFLSSQMHQGGSFTADAKAIQSCGYGDSKLHNTMMAFAFARKWPRVEVSSLDPGWVRTKMGGQGASDSLDDAVESYVHVTEGTGRSGEHWYHGRERGWKKEAGREEGQESLLRVLGEISGVQVPKV